MLNSTRTTQCYKAALFSASATCFVIPFATSLISLFSILTVLFWLFSGKINNILQIIKANSFAMLASVLFCYFLVGLIYTPADISEALSFLKKYRELVFIPICLSLFAHNHRVRKTCEKSFVAGCIVLLCISYCMFFQIIPSAKYGNSIVFHITHSFFMSFLAFWAANKAFDNAQYRYGFILLLLLTLVNLFYIAPGRIGMLTFICLALLLIVQRFRIKHIFYGILTLSLLVTAAYFTSSNFSSRTTSAIEEIQQYEYGASRTSLGQRFDWWYNSLVLIKEKPVQGHGTGSFPKVHDDFIQNSQLKDTDNPHNEFLLIGVQLGVPGMLLFLLLFVAQFYNSLKLKKPDKYLAQGVMVSMFIGCLINSFLFDSHQGHFYAFVSAVYLFQADDIDET